MLFTGSKNIDFSRRYVPKKLVFYKWESRLSLEAFISEKIYLLLEFLRYLLAVFGVLKEVNLRKENLEWIFDFLIWEFLRNFFFSKKDRKLKNRFLLEQ